MNLVEHLAAGRRGVAHALNRRHPRREHLQAVPDADRQGHRGGPRRADLPPGVRRPRRAADFTFTAGQFGVYCAFGEGECTFCIASPPTRKGYIECTFRQVGRVTDAPRRPGRGRHRRLPRAVRQRLPDRGVARQETSSSSPAASRCRRCAASSGTCLDLRDKFEDVTDRLRRAHGAGPRLQARAGRSGAARPTCKLVTTVDPGRRDAGLEGQGRLRARRSSSKSRRRRRTPSPSSAARRS